MNLAKKGSPAGYGALLGALAGLLLIQLGIQGILGFASEAAIVVTMSIVGIGVFVIGVRFIRLALVALDLVLLAFYLVLAFTPVAGHLAAGWLRRDPLPPRSDAVIVLSSGVLPDSALSVDGLERLLFGLELMHGGAAPRLVTTRTIMRFGDLVVSSDVDQKRLISMLLNPARWDVVGPAINTHDEAALSARLLLPASRNVVVVTSPMHARRACATFEQTGFSVSCQPAREHDFVTSRPTSPEARLDSFRAYVYERLGMLKYRWKGWLRP